MHGIRSTRPDPVPADTEKTAERGRFDAAHELGHLVLHGEEQMPHGPQAAAEAHRFAAASLSGSR
ncbi:ImmA/IrrE family metallo-endopeptidase [Streptomyces massasporeus]